MSFFFMSCEKSPTESNTIETPKIIWRKQLGPKSFDQISSDPILYENDLLFGYQTETTQGYYRFDKSNGQLIRKYDDVNSSNYTSYLVDNKYFSTLGSKARILNLRTNEIENFTINFETNVPSIFASKINNSLFLAVNGNINSSGNYPINEYKIIRANNDLKSWKEVWSNKYQKEEGIFGTDIKFLARENTTNGGEIIYFPSQLAYKVNIKLSKYRMESVNISTNQLVWQTEVSLPDSVLSHGLSNFSPQIFGNIIIAGISGRHLVAFDKNTGKQLWSNYFANALLTTEMIVYNKKISIMDNSSNLYLIDLATGTIIRKQDLVAGDTRKWVILNEKIYFTTASGKLYGIDANTHNIFWEARSPNKDNCSYCNYYAASPVLDPATNRLYISDRKEVICYQLPY